MNKSGAKPTKDQKKRMTAMGLIWQEWLVVRDCSTIFELVNRTTGARKFHFKGGKN